MQEMGFQGGKEESVRACLIESAKIGKREKTAESSLLSFLFPGITPDVYPEARSHIRAAFI